MRKPKPLPGKEAFCFNCHQFRPYYTEIERCEDVFPSLGRKRFFVHATFPQMVARCAKCGEELYVSDIHDKNMDVRGRAGLAPCDRCSQYNKEAEDGNLSE